MKIDPNDPRLTAYALNELDGSERAAVEALLKDDEIARREIETIRRATTMVSEKLQSEPCPRLNPEQLAVIRERFAAHENQTHAFPWWRIFGWTAALGGAVVIAAMFLPALNQAQKKPQQLAMQMPIDKTVPSAAPQYDTVRVQLAPMANTPPVNREQSKLTLDMKTEEPRSLVGVGRTDALGLAQRPAEAQMANSSQSETTFYQAPQSVVLPSSQANGGATVESMNHQSGLPQGQLAATDVTIYRGAQARITQYDDLSSPNVPVRRKDSGGNILWQDGHVEWQNSFPSTAQPSLLSQPNTESYRYSVENAFVTVTQNPLSTFSLDVDTASYANIRRFLNQGTLPPRDAVRIEEMLNYFPYDYPAPPRGEPFSLYAEMAECPWNSAHRLALVALKAKDVAPRKLQPMNLVFLIDVSGSMADANKLPLVKQSLRLLVERLTARDRVAIVVYAGESRVALPSTSGDDKETILAVIDSLEASGSTNGGEGIQSAYREATANFIEGGVNRVILSTDGDFNVGITDQNELVRMIQQESKSGVFLTILGVGMGNLKDSTMQKLADKGNGNYAYIDTLDEANKVLVEQMRGTLVAVAKDTKIQIEFNPALVQSYRLIGYENRTLRPKDFNNDRKGAGEVGAGRTVTALYEIVPSGAPPTPGVDPLKYQPAPPQTTFGDELMTVKLRYKDPDASSSRLLTAPVKDQHTAWRGTSTDFRFAASVAAFGLTLRDSPYKGAATFGLALELAQGAQGYDENGYRSEFISLVNQARALHGNITPDDP